MYFSIKKKKKFLFYSSLQKATKREVYGIAGITDTSAAILFYS